MWKIEVIKFLGTIALMYIMYVCVTYGKWDEPIN